MITVVDMPEGWNLFKIGPVITFTSEDTVVVMLIAWRQDGCSTAVLSRWDIDSDCSCERHMNLSWDEYWEKFLDLIPDDYVAAVAHSERTVKY